MLTSYLDTISRIGAVGSELRQGLQPFTIALQQLVESNRQFPNSLPGRVKNRVGDGCCRARDAYFAEPSRTQRRMFIEALESMVSAI